MFTQRIPLEATTIEVLHFDVPESNASITMAESAARFSADIGADFISLDVWINPDAVVEHRLVIGPAIVVMADGAEVARLAGPRWRRGIERFLSKVAPAFERVSVAA